MPVEDVFSIKGRGTVAPAVSSVASSRSATRSRSSASARTARRPSPASRCSTRPSTRARPATTSACLLRGVEKDHDRARPGDLQAGLDHAAHQVQGPGLRADEGRGRPSHAVLQQLPPAVLLPHDGRDRLGQLLGGAEMCMPGDNVEIEVELGKPDRDGEGLRFAVREGGRTVGSGVSPRSSSNVSRSRPRVADWQSAGDCFSRRGLVRWPKRRSVNTFGCSAPRRAT
jgi:elongation factor Tu